MLFRTRAAIVAASLLVATAPSAQAQIDYRNLDGGRPTLVEDAYPVERHAFELLLPYSVTRSRGSTTHVTALELAHGIANGLHAGFEVPFAGVEGPSGRTWSLEGPSFFALYNFNTESGSLPAVSARLDTHGELKLISTRSFGRSRLHLNGAVELGRHDDTDLGEHAARWWYGAALDRTLVRRSLLLIGELYARRETDALPVEVNASLGARWQWRPTVVVDVGVSRRLRATGPDVALTFGLSKAFGIAALMPSAPRRLTSRPGGAHRRSEQFYYPGAFNWQFLRRYPGAAGLFNAFDYGHAILYEQLYDHPDSAAAARELEREYRYLTTDLLVRTPRFAIAEEAVMPSYARLAWRAKMMFDWAHVLHRQIYDVYADERLADDEKRALVERLTDYYLSNASLAFASEPKSMALMDEQYYSQVFRRQHPVFNGLIWAYHWLQVGLYEPLIVATTPAERQAGVQEAVDRFWSMLDQPPAAMPRVMPMTITVAPVFTARHPRAAAIFDNLHMMHDIISDVLAADTVPRERKREVIYAALEELRHPSRHVITHQEWRDMGVHMGGIEAMGGPVMGPRRPAPAAPHHQH